MNTIYNIYIGSYLRYNRIISNLNNPIHFYFLKNLQYCIRILSIFTLCFLILETYAVFFHISIRIILHFISRLSR